MGSEFADIQQDILDDALKHYSKKTVEHFMNPCNLGPMDDADAFAEFHGPCGDTIGIWVRMDADVIEDVRFTTDGCGTSIASGSMVTVLAKGKTLTEAESISQEQILEELGGFPEDKEHCALLAVMSLRKALKKVCGE